MGTPQLDSPPAKPEPIASEADHDHGFAPTFLPHGMQERWAALGRYLA